MTQPLNKLMNRLENWSVSDSLFKSEILARSAVITLCLPLEVLATAQKIVHLQLQTLQILLKIPAKIFNIGIASPTLREWDYSLAGPLDFIKTTLKIVGFAFGTLFTTTLGFLSPSKNFRLHVAFGLITDEKAIALRKKFELEITKERETQRHIIQTHIKNLILSQRLKNAEKERLVAQHALQIKLENAQNKESIPTKTPLIDLSTPTISTIPASTPENPPSIPTQNDKVEEAPTIPSLQSKDETSTTPTPVKTVDTEKTPSPPPQIKKRFFAKLFNRPKKTNVAV